MRLSRLHIIALLSLIASVSYAQQHPMAYVTKADIGFVKNSLLKNQLLQTSFNDIKNSVDVWVGKDVDVHTKQMQLNLIRQLYVIVITAFVRVSGLTI